MNPGTTNDPQIFDRLRQYLQDEFPNQGVELTGDTRLLDEWFVDSMGIIETVIFIEREFGVTMTRADINGETFQDIDSLVAFIGARTAS